jgi:hypothetical protein
MKVRFFERGKAHLAPGEFGSAERGVLGCRLSGRERARIAPHRTCDLGNEGLTGALHTSRARQRESQQKAITSDPGG